MLIFSVWYSFIWRYFSLHYILLLSAGALLNILGRFDLLSGHLYWITLLSGGVIKLLCGSLIFCFVWKKHEEKLREQTGRSDLLIRRKWYLAEFLLRFTVSTVLIALLLGGMFPLFVLYCGGQTSQLLRVSGYLGHFAMFPGALIAFGLMIRRHRISVRNHHSAVASLG